MSNWGRTLGRMLLGIIFGALFALFVGNTFDRCLAEQRERHTRVSLRGTKWMINDEITYPGAPAEGLLMNVRMVNATFEDRNRADFDPEANTQAFLNVLPEYVDAGVRAFTFNLQGGFPGYEGALNSAFETDGSLRPEYLARMEKVLDACDRLGAVAILGCFYQRQDQVLANEEAVQFAVKQTVDWIRRKGYTNVVLEIANEFPHRGFDHPILRTPSGQVELIRLARREAPGLLVSTSGLGDGRLPVEVAEASDFLLIHFNSTPLRDIPERIRILKRFGKPIVCNEDDKWGADAAQACRLCVAEGASYGLMLKKLNQYVPFEFKGVRDDPVFYSTLRMLTRAKSSAD